ncbi:MAG: NADH-quinone oxidoreductase subunit N [Anaerolineae bacterium]|nr:NADH-quinone oxidoreductase subunit N [Anaerolineae bacterium]
MFEAPTLDTLWGYNLSIALPAIWLASSVLIVLLIDLFTGEERKHWTPLAALAAIVIAFVLQMLNFAPEETTAFGGMFAADAFTSILSIVALGTAFLAILLSGDYLKKANIAHGEFYALLLLTTSGAMFMASANNLIVMFVALELLSIPLYILAAFRATDPEHISRKSGLKSVGDIDASILKSEESGMKYFILGAFSSAFFVYGAAFIYGATGTTNLQEIFAAVQSSVIGDQSATFLLLAGAGMAVVGLGFKVAAVPFHMWTPDVYEGAPTPITAYMSVAAKVGGFGALLRLMITGLQHATVSADVNVAAWVITIQVIAAATLIIGNVVAISQANVKRMLAYSSIAHAGYILMAVAAVGVTSAPDIATTAAQAVAVYLLAYMFTNIGAFAVVQAIENKDGSGTNLEDFAGLFNSKPLLAVAMTIFMLSLTGIPLTGGFFGKWLVFGAAVKADLIILAVIGVLTSVISAFYYMRVVVKMFLRDDVEGNPAPGATRSVTMAIYASMAGVLITGIAVPLVTNLVNKISF